MMLTVVAADPLHSHDRADARRSTGERRDTLRDDKRGARVAYKTDVEIAVCLVAHQGHAPADLDVGMLHRPARELRDRHREILPRLPALDGSKECNKKPDHGAHFRTSQVSAAATPAKSRAIVAWLMPIPPVTPAAVGPLELSGGAKSAW